MTTRRRRSERALALGALDCARSTVPAAVAEAQAVFVAVPVGGLSALVGEALAAAPADCVVTDVGSTKREVVAAHHDPRFVGGHPLAGAENAGVEHARADLFEAATWYLTPSAGTSGMLYERLHRLLHGIGARPDGDRRRDPRPHPRRRLAPAPRARQRARLPGREHAGRRRRRAAATGPSFRDATRVAGAPSAIWTDIYLSNRDALTAQVDGAIARLTRSARRSPATGLRSPGGTSGPRLTGDGCWRHNWPAAI